MTGQRKAVFLSYAAEDGDAARRVSSALRNGGVEVWFDQSELRGGEAWDLHIRRQIAECALFVPLISANTQARSEGYFRLEWDLADQRSHMIARSRAFILPVCVDDTLERDAEVPESFLKVQWTRLASGGHPTDFVAHIVNLIAHSPPAVSPQSPALTARSSATTPPSRPVPRLGSKRVLSMVVVATAVLLVSYLAIDRFLIRSSSNRTQVSAQSESVGSVSSKMPDKSVAVLPFVDMSERKDQEYLSDGLSEELINLLAQVRDLKVPARTSSFSFKGKQSTVGEIAHTLGVAHVLEGSVRKAGNTVRITAQLVRANDGFHVWSETYDRDLKDIFRLQDEIAAKVVAALKATLLTGSSNDRTTTNMDAYALTLQGRLLHARGTAADLHQAVATLERAVALDPTYVPAWADLAQSHFDLYDLGFASAVDTLPRARATAERALAMAPAYGPAHWTLGWVKMYGDNDWHGAREELDAAKRADPMTPQPDWLGLYAGCVSGPCFDEFLRDASLDLERDPLNPAKYALRGTTYYRGGKPEVAEPDLRHSLELSPSLGLPRFILAQVLIQRQDFDGALQVADAGPKDFWGNATRALAYDAVGRHSDADRLLASQTQGAFESPYYVARIYNQRGDVTKTFEWLETAYKERDHFMLWLKIDPAWKPIANEPRFKSYLARIKFPD